VAFLLLTVARVNAVASFRLGHINIDDRSIFSGREDGKDKEVQVLRNHLLSS
jgi:hypothetical protein